MRAGTFKVCITPALGAALCGGYLPRATRVVSDLYLRGLVLEEDGQRYVIAGMDCCYLIGKSQDRFEEALAMGAGVGREHVTLNTNHAHAAPMFNEEAHALLAQTHPDKNFHDEPYFAELLQRATLAVRKTLQQGLWEVSGVGYANHPVEEFASNRRVFLEPGKASVRWSITRDPSVRQAPVGPIDPLLDLVTLFDASGKPRASLAYFACHPQVGYVEGVIHPDTPGIAMALFEEQHPGTLPLFFNGCGGDITAGKYTSTNPSKNNLVFGVKLFDALEEAFLKTRAQAPGKLTWKTISPMAPLAPVQFTRETLQNALESPTTSDSEKVLAAFKLHRLNTQTNQYPFKITLAHLGNIGLLMLPSELSITYQAYAKQNHRGPLAVAAYADAYLNYVAYDKAFEEAGYEVDPWWTEVGPGIEAWIKAQLDTVLG